MPTDARWERLNALFHEATQLDPARRQSFLDNACADDTGLRKEVERLIDAHERADQFIDRPVIGIRDRA